MKGWLHLQVISTILAVMMTMMMTMIRLCGDDGSACGDDKLSVENLVEVSGKPII